MRKGYKGVNAGSRKQSAFTLIELLVVIAIIAILAAILFPVFAQAREKARQTSCLSNMRQLTMGMVTYCQDYDENFPGWKWDQEWAQAPGNKNNGTSLWHNAIFPYVKSVQVYTCPSDARPDWQRTNWSGWFNMSTVVGIPREIWNPATGKIAVISYGASEPLTYAYPGLASIGSPADTMLLGDMITTLTGWEGWDDWNAIANNPAVPANDPRRSYRIRRLAYPKEGTCMPNDFWTDPAWRGPFKPEWLKCAQHSATGNNVGFADGHVKFVQTARSTLDLYGIIR